jgi:tRNA-uridine 2-sulfurtransferase
VRVLAALSGGVDSAVAAARVVAQGHDVTAVHFALSADPAATREGSRGCCTLSDARDARRAADAMGIPFYVWDLAERFREEVIEDFLAEYAAGRTPNPCVRCNERIKFAAVLERAVDLGFDAVCTGHYAQVGTDTDGRPWLRRGVDPDKDQSYVLAVLTADQLRHTMLPLGDSTKPAVRDEAAERGLKVARKPDSHDICFIPDGDTRTWLGARLGVRTGSIIDAVTGDELGRHDGTHGFTIGQRRGLGLTRPAPDGQPRYVVRIDPLRNEVIVGPARMLDALTILTAVPTWVGATGPEDLVGEVHVQIRAHGEALPARVTATDTGLRAELDQPVRAVAAGQTLVVYRDDAVLASATIVGD